VSSFLLGGLFLYLGWAALLFFSQRQMLFPRGVIPVTAPPPQTAPGLRMLRLPMPDGDVEAWFLPPAGGGPAPALLFTHGNAELIDHWVEAMASFSARGVGVMLVEYPGYGRSEGTPSYASIRAATLAAYDMLAARPEVDPARIVAYGRSLGGGAAAIVARERPVSALILQSAFTSTRAFARRYLLPGFLVRDRFEVLDAVRELGKPVLVIHGEQDEVIPVAHGRALAASAVGATLVIHRCAHNDCPPDWSAHVEQVLRFLRETRI
jgi:fermentation-respiration switch protein FrsA (DUF1100 family)